MIIPVRNVRSTGNIGNILTFWGFNRHHILDEELKSFRIVGSLDTSEISVEMMGRIHDHIPHFIFRLLEAASGLSQAKELRRLHNKIRGFDYDTIQPPSSSSSSISPSERGVLHMR